MEKPILFNSEMIKSITRSLNPKTQTRRVVKGEKCPYGQQGVRLWVRETWMPDSRGDEDIAGIRYKADNQFIQIENTSEAADYWLSLRKKEEQWPILQAPKWRPSIFMPRGASRLTLQVTAVRQEPLQDITEAEAQREGWRFQNLPQGHAYDGTHHATDWFRDLWDSINKKRGYGWDSNPLVWVVDFELLSKEAA